MFANPILGSLSDKFGRRPVLILSKLGTMLAYIILANAFTYWVFLFSRLLDGFTGGNISVARAYVADVTEPKDRARGMAIIGMAFGTGFILGPALGGILFSMFDTHTIPCYFAAGLSAIAVIFTVLFLEEPTKKIHTTNQIDELHHSWAFIKKPMIYRTALIDGRSPLYLRLCLQKPSQHRSP